MAIVPRLTGAAFYADEVKLGAAAFHCFIDNCTRERPDLPPLVSVFTAAYRTGERIARAYASLTAQQYGNLEWIVVADSDDDDVTFAELASLARAWLADCYREIGGHGRFIPVADDYELLVRTFLHTRMARVPELGYLQWRNADGNTHRARNAEIQRLVAAFSRHYDAAIHRRLCALGVDDFVWTGHEPSLDRLDRVPNPTIEPHCSLVLPRPDPAGDRPALESTHRQADGG